MEGQALPSLPAHDRRLTLDGAALIALILISSSKLVHSGQDPQAHGLGAGVAD